jgi:hypothetical protein
MKKSLALSHSLYGLSLLSGCGSGSSASFPLLTIPTASLPNGPRPLSPRPNIQVWRASLLLRALVAVFESGMR